jgi:signal transduction histidine kinase
VNAAGSSPRDERPFHVLIVDGNAAAGATLPALQEQCISLLLGDGFALSAPPDPAMTAAALPEILAREDYDVVLCRLSTLEKEGVDPLSLTTASDAQAVLVVDGASAADVSRLVDEGVFECVVGPLDPAALWLAVRRAAEHRRRLAERRRRDAELSRRSLDLELRGDELAGRTAEIEKRDVTRHKLRQLVVHDLKNQIAVVKSNLSFVIEEGTALPSRPTLEVAEAAIEEVLGMALAMADVPSSLTPVRESVALGPLLGRIAVDQAVFAVPAGVALEVVDDGPAIAQVDAKLVRRVVTNLVENALRHARARRVWLSARSDARGHAVVAVEDDGIGVPATVRQSIGDPAPPTGSRIGVGLRFCRAAVAAHGGRLWIEERSPSGTAVRFTLSGASDATPLRPIR